MFTFNQGGAENSIVLSHVVFTQQRPERKQYRVCLSDGNYVDIPWDIKGDFIAELNKYFGLVEVIKDPGNNEVTLDTTD